MLGSQMIATVGKQNNTRLMYYNKKVKQLKTYKLQKSVDLARN